MYFPVVRLALFMVSAALAFPQASPQSEAALRERVAKFWDGFVSGKYRQSDNYVADSAKEDFFSWPKKKIRGYQIEQIHYTEDKKSAKVITFVDTTLAMMGVGSMDIKQPVETWWKLEDEGWFWFLPANQVRDTPFGKMEANPKSGDAPLVPIGEMNFRPNLEELMSKVKPDREEVRFTMGTAGRELVKFRNAMPGTVTLTIDTPLADDMTFALSSRSIARDGEADLIIDYKPHTKPADDAEAVTKVVRVGVAQTGKLYSIRVVLTPPEPK
jgi:hypothetical protein